MQQYLVGPALLTPNVQDSLVAPNYVYVGSVALGLTVSAKTFKNYAYKASVSTTLTVPATYASQTLYQYSGARVNLTLGVAAAYRHDYAYKGSTLITLAVSGKTFLNNVYKGSVSLTFAVASAAFRGFGYRGSIPLTLAASAAIQRDYAYSGLVPLTTVVAASTFKNFAYTGSVPLSVLIQAATFRDFGYHGQTNLTLAIATSSFIIRTYQGSVPMTLGVNGKTFKNNVYNHARVDLTLSTLARTFPTFAFVGRINLILGLSSVNSVRGFFDPWELLLGEIMNKPVLVSEIRGFVAGDDVNVKRTINLTNLAAGDRLAKAWMTVRSMVDSADNVLIEKEITPSFDPLNGIISDPGSGMPIVAEIQFFLRDFDTEVLEGDEPCYFDIRTQAEDGTKSTVESGIIVAKTAITLV